MGFFAVLQSLWKVKRSVDAQKAFNQHYLVPILNASKAQQDGSLTDADYKRILETDAINISVVIGQSFAELRAKSLSIRERTAITNMAALTLLYDDYFDRFTYDKKAIELLMRPGDYVPLNSHETLFRRFFNGSINNIPDEKRLFDFAKKVLDAQYESKAQAEKALSYEEIFDLTRKKGGNSILFYRSALENPLSEAEELLAFEVGAMIQLGDDIFDTYWDANNSIRTFTTVSNDLNRVDLDFRRQIERCFSAIGPTPFSQSSQKKFRSWLAFAASLSLSALDQLKALQEKSMGYFEPLAYTRAEMICDMQKQSSRWRAFMHFLKLDARK